MTKQMVAIGIAMLSAACSFVEPIPGSNGVILSNDLESCTVIGETTVEVLETVAYMDIRREEAIFDELQIMARNEAVRKKANAIWPTSEIEAGKQSFNLLRCRSQ